MKSEGNQELKPSIGPQNKMKGINIPYYLEKLSHTRQNNRIAPLTILAHSALVPHCCYEPQTGLMILRPR